MHDTTQDTNQETKILGLVSRWCPTTVPVTVVLLFAFFEFSSSSMPLILAHESYGLAEELVVDESATHFVAVNGNDNGPGTSDRPWATINIAAERAKAGDTVVVRGGNYVLPAQVRPHNSGRSDAWISFIGYPGEKAILDAQLVPGSSLAQGGLDNGAFQIEGVSYLRVIDLTIVNSHDAGIAVRDSSNIDLINNSTKGTFSSGIAVWNTNHGGTGTEQIRILGNTIVRATTWDFASLDVPRQREPPHESISIGGAADFEIAYNHVYDSDKEGIDIKETSKRGKVHHNVVHGLGRQGIYVDAWFGEISDIEIFSNVIHDCQGAGIVLSVENGQSVESVNIHNNLVFNNDGSGLFFSRWGVDGMRRNIKIHNNVFYHNGYGPPRTGQTYYWLTGGIYLYSNNVRDITIRKNIFSENYGFQIGYSELFLNASQSWEAVEREKNIQIAGNLIDGPNAVDSPIESGGYPGDRVKIYAVNGLRAILNNPIFKDRANQDFIQRRDSSVAGHILAEASAPESSPLWWKRGFPPRLFHIHFDRSALRFAPVRK
jgi:parallel beta-helix repeat protein